jgi:hypothetical protein
VTGTPTNPTEGSQRGWRVAKKQHASITRQQEPRQNKIVPAENESLSQISLNPENPMSPRLEDDTWCTGENILPVSHVSLGTATTKQIKPTRVGARIKRVAARLFYALPRGNNRPKVGQMCLVMTGETGNDEGQMAVVSDRTTSMVRITYMCNPHGLIKSKLKRPSSLVMLDPAVTLVQDDDGTMWIRPHSE